MTKRRKKKQPKLDSWSIVGTCVVASAFFIGYFLLLQAIATMGAGQVNTDTGKYKCMPLGHQLVCIGPK